MSDMAHNRTLFLTVAIVGALFLSVGVGLVTAQDGGDWSQFQSDEGNTGHNPGGAGPTDGVQTRWTPFSTGGEARSPVVVGGTAYFGSTDDSVYAVDTSTGNQEWKFGTSGDVKTPAVDSGTVYVLRAEGVRYTH